MINNNREYILCAAIHYTEEFKTFLHKDVVHQVTNVDKGIVLCGYRHNNIIEQFSTLTNLRTVPLDVDFKQGFLTSQNRFVDRKEAAVIAFNSDQIQDIKKELFSEDLY